MASKTISQSMFRGKLLFKTQNKKRGSVTKDIWKLEVT